MNGILIADKPEGWTSHDVVAKLRRVLREKRIGHGGTLDPMASGVLPLFVGRATRAVEFIETADKEYVAGARFGIATDTYDMTGRILEERAAVADERGIEEALRSFLGESSQLPPPYSAVKIRGKKLYEYARGGRDVERSPRSVVIYEIEPLGFCGGDKNEYRFRIVCSKGTYIRTVCHDLGLRLGCGAALSYLRRTRVGSFEIGAAAGLDELLAAAEEASIGKYFLPTDSLFAAYPELAVGAEAERRLRIGAEIRLGGLADGRYRVYGESGDFLAFSEAENGVLRAIKSFYEV